MFLEARNLLKDQHQMAEHVEILKCFDQSRIELEDLRKMLPPLMQFPNVHYKALKEQLDKYLDE